MLLAEGLKAVIRSRDVVARVGGGEEWTAEEAGAVVARVAAAAGLGEEAAQ